MQLVQIHIVSRFNIHDWTPKHFCLVAILYLFPLIESKLCGGERAEKVKNAVSQWIEVENSISKESIEWNEKKILLKNLADVLRQELKIKNEELDKTKLASDASSLRRNELLKTKESNAELISLVREKVTTFENHIKTLRYKLPNPLQSKLAPMVKRFPLNEETDQVSLASRLQNVIGIITEIQNFDLAVTTGEELLEGEKNAKEIKTLHIGLGASYYVSSDGVDSGIGLPTKEGWKWIPVEGLNDKVKSILSMITNNTFDPELISLPVSTIKAEK